MVYCEFSDSEVIVIKCVYVLFHDFVSCEIKAFALNIVNDDLEESQQFF